MADHGGDAFLAERSLFRRVAGALPPKSKNHNTTGPGLFLRVQILEQYEDTLANLDIEPEAGQSEGFDFDDPAFSLHYRLQRES